MINKNLLYTDYSIPKNSEQARKVSLQKRERDLEFIQDQTTLYIENYEYIHCCVTLSIQVSGGGYTSSIWKCTYACLSI